MTIHDQAANLVGMTTQELLVLRDHIDTILQYRVLGDPFRCVTVSAAPQLSWVARGVGMKP